MTDKLYFNGVNASTGQYGLSPMSVPDMAARIWDDRLALWKRGQSLMKQFGSSPQNHAKQMELLRVIMRGVEWTLSGAHPSRRTWYRSVAQAILIVVLGKQPTPGEVTTLARKLRQDSTGVVTSLFELLGRDAHNDGNRNEELSRLLFLEEPENTGPLSTVLLDRFDRMLAEVKTELLTQDAAVVLSGDGTLQLRWIDRLWFALTRLPVDATRVTLSSDPLEPALRKLIVELAKPERSITAYPNHSHDLVSRLQDLLPLDEETTWMQVISTLRMGLWDLQRAGVPVVWPNLQGVLHQFLNTLCLEITGHLNVSEHIDPKDLAQAGWGVVFPALMPENQRNEIKKALAPLMLLRQQQAGPLYFVFEAESGYRPRDTASSFLKRAPRNARLEDPVEPEQTHVPYYLLLVGSPEAIPWEFQYQLDVQYAVGRIDFDNDMIAYANYAQNVVAAELRADTESRDLLFFGTQHVGDGATRMSAEYLVQPLYAYFNRNAEIKAEGWKPALIAPHSASKENLIQQLSQDKSPAFLFAATHGLEYDAGEAAQVLTQGALLCQEWSGSLGQVGKDAIFSADDIDDELNLSGLITFFFACYGAGTPRVDEYYRRDFLDTGRVVANDAFVAALPKAMLSLRDKGALAVVGHVDRVWGLSFLDALPGRPGRLDIRKNEYVGTFVSSIERLLKGYPLGAAMEYFDQRYAALATELTALYESMDAAAPPLSIRYQLAELWTAHNDARGYVILGDPAVRLGAAMTAQAAVTP